MKFRSIAYICNEYPLWSKGGGIGTFTKEMATRLAEYGVKVYIIGCSDELKKPITVKKHNIYVSGIPYYNIPRVAPWINRIRLSIHLSYLISKYKIDVVECPEYLGWLWPFKPVVPVIIRFHSSSRLPLLEKLRDDGRKWPSWAHFEERTILNGQAYCAVSDYLARRLKEVIPIMADKKIEIIHNGIDTLFFKPGEKSATSQKTVVFVGRITREKGVPELLKAWSIVCEKERNAKLILIGRDGSGSVPGTSLMDELKQQYGGLIKSGRVVFTGPKESEDVKEKLAAATLCVFPSHREANPISVLEAMSCGSPVICSNHTGFVEIIRNGDNGILCNCKDEVELAREITTLLRDSSLRERVGANARDSIVRKFDSRNILLKNIELYENVAGKK